jgi:glucuronoarabinoxylan endo-1,4-beta-xylanase
MKKSAVLASKYGKEVWMTEHSVTDNVDRLPNWHEQLLFAEEVNECIQAGCTGYIYWYLRAHWAFVSTGEAKYGAENKTKNRLLPRAYVMSHFSKNVTGATRLETKGISTTVTNAAYEATAYIKGDSLIVMAIDTTKNAVDLKLQLPMKVKSGTHLLSTGNETAKLCQETPITIDEPVDEITVSIPSRSLNTLIFKIDQGDAAIRNVKLSEADGPKTYYDLHGRRIDGSKAKGVCIERLSDGTSKKVFMGD